MSAPPTPAQAKANESLIKLRRCVMFLPSEIDLGMSMKRILGKHAENWNE